MFIATNSGLDYQLQRSEMFPRLTETVSLLRSF
jgi:hypothetical protein